MRYIAGTILCVWSIVAVGACRTAHRIISLAPNLTELVYTVGAGSALIATDTGSDFPKRVKALPKVANYRDLDLEKIVSLRPDLVLAWRGGSPAAQLQQLKALHIPVASFRVLHLSDIPKAIRRLGCLTGHTAQANQQAALFEQHYHAFKNTYAHAKPISVFYQLGTKPLLTLNQYSLINDMITTCGGQNVFAKAKGLAPELSMEAVIAANPQVILGPPGNWQKMWQKWPVMDAVKRNNMFTIQSDYVLRATFRSLTGLAEICRDLKLARANTSR